MSKRKNPYSQENTSPTKKRKIDNNNNNDNSNNNWCIKLKTTQNGTKNEEKEFSINNTKTFKVGRDPSICSVVFSETPMVSRIHCQFIYNPNNQNKLFVKDLKST